MAAESDVDEIASARAGERDPQQGVRLRRQGRVRRELPDDAGGESAYPIAEFGQHITHQPVVLKAVPASAPKYQLVGQRLWTEVVDRHPQQRVEVLERNRSTVHGHQILQNIQGWIGSAAIVDAIEVRGQIQCHVAILTSSPRRTDRRVFGRSSRSRPTMSHRLWFAT